jgi:hypothetical protein
MKILDAEDAKSWLRARRKAAAATSVNVVWPGEPVPLRNFTTRLSEISEWRGGAVILDRPGMPRDEGLAWICAFQQAHGVSSTPGDIRLGLYPGHLLDDDPVTNQGHVQGLLQVMMGSFLEGHLATKDGRFIASVCCGIVELRVSDKSLSGRVRGIIQDLELSTI